MNIGKMRHRIALKKPIIGEDVGFGSVIEWKDVGSVWAEFLKQRITPSDYRRRHGCLDNARDKNTATRNRKRMAC